MPVVMVHGNPETDAVWGPLVAELGCPTSSGCRRPGGVRRRRTVGPPPSRSTGVGWSASWRRSASRSTSSGHDWGGGHALNVAMTRPDLLRTWVSDLLGCFDPDYVWHPLAQGWQTPGGG